MTETRRELADVERRINGIVMALSEGLRAESVKAELARLEQRQATLRESVAELALPDFGPELANLFRQKAESLSRDLENDDRRDSARETLRGFLKQIVIAPGEESMRVEGNLSEMLAAAQGRSATAQAVAIFGCGGTQPP
jgi:site-specific DNA recombinase